MRGPGPGPTLVSCTAEKGLSAPASPRVGGSSLPGPWTAQPASQADVTTPRPSRALRLRLPGEGSGVGRRGQQCWPESCPGQERERETERKSCCEKPRATPRAGHGVRQKRGRVSAGWPRPTAPAS